MQKNTGSENRAHEYNQKLKQRLTERNDMKHAIYNWNHAMHRYQLLKQAGINVNGIT